MTSGADKHSVTQLLNCYYVWKIPSGVRNIELYIFFTGFFSFNVSFVKSVGGHKLGVGIEPVFLQSSERAHVPFQLMIRKPETVLLSFPKRSLSL